MNVVEKGKLVLVFYESIYFFLVSSGYNIYSFFLECCTSVHCGYWGNLLNPSLRLFKINTFYSSAHREIAIDAKAKDFKTYKKR